MSLINRMLQDLDKHDQAGNSGAAVITAGLQPGASLPAAKKPVTLIFIATALLTSLGVWSWQQAPVSAPPDAASPAPVLTVKPIMIQDTVTSETSSDGIDSTPDDAEQATPHGTMGHRDKTSAMGMAPATDHSTDKTITMGIATPSQPAAAATKKSTRIATGKARRKQRNNDTASTATNTLHKMAVGPGPLEIAEYHYTQAGRYLAQGRLSEALFSLYETLRLNPQHHKARSVLAQQLIRQQDWQEAQQLLQRGIHLAPDHYPFSQMLGRVLIARGDDSGAVIVQENALAYGSSDPDYLGQLAIAYQRTRQYDKAITLFNRSLQMQPLQGRWWLGLAISLESLHQWGNARQAYQRAFNSNGLPVRLKTFAQQKIATLTRVRP